MQEAQSVWFSPSHHPNGFSQYLFCHANPPYSKLPDGLDSSFVTVAHCSNSSCVWDVCNTIRKIYLPCVVNTGISQHRNGRMCAEAAWFGVCFGFSKCWSLRDHIKLDRMHKNEALGVLTKTCGSCGLQVLIWSHAGSPKPEKCCWSYFGCGPWWKDPSAGPHEASYKPII